MTVVLDSSAVLAAILGERGGDVAYAAMGDGVISIVNLCEIYTRLIESGADIETIERQVGRLDLVVAPFEHAQALRAATLRPPTRFLGLSFGDRACLAHALLTGLPVLTGDRDWKKLDLGLDIRLIR